MALMRLIRQIWTLTRKDLTIVIWHSWLSTFLRAVALPIAYMFFIAYVRNFFLPPSEYGIASLYNPIRNLTTEVFNSSTSLGGRNRVVFVNEGSTGGQIDTLIEQLAGPLEKAGADVYLTSNEDDLFDICPSTLTGLSPCYGAVTFESSPTEGGIWAYTARADFGLGLSPYVNQDDNDAQVFVLPFIHAIDAEIARMEGSNFPLDQYEYPFTYETRQDRADDIQQFFMRALNSYLAVTMFIGICGITYHLPGHLATEREIGISSLIDSMLYTSHQAYAMIARLVSVYVSFTIVYLPSWLAMGAIVATLMFEQTSASIVVPFHLLTGLSLTGYSIFMASLFRKAQLSGTTTLLLGLILAILTQFIPRTETAQGVLGCLFPPATYTFFQIEIANMEQDLEPYGLYQSDRYFWRSSLNGYLYFVFLAVQIVLYPLLACLVQWSMYGTPNRCRKGLSNGNDSALRIVNVSKVFYPSWWQRIFAARKSAFTAVDDLSLSLSTGHVVALLGANGSGKSTTLAAIAGTQSTTKGHIERDPQVALGFCPQKNVLWDELSVLQHVQIFNSLKAKDKVQSKHELTDLIVACDLEKKIKKKSKTLSGGQKRKLQLAMAFVGRSQVCCVDEVSSGLDPLSRRKIWNILLSERERRTLLLTTHALDEADALADDIVIMSKGQLVVQGSAPELKHEHGGGYQVVTRDPRAGHLQHLNPQIGLGGDYHFNAANSAQARDVAKQVRSNGIKDLQIHGPTIQDVFLGLSREFAEESSQMPSSTLLDDRSSSDSRDLTVPPVVQPKIKDNALSIESGQGSSFLRQTWILYRKRLLIFRRNWLPYFCLLVIPIITAGLTTMFLAGFTPLQCSRGQLANNPQRLSLGALERFWGILVPVGPSSQFSLDQLPAQYQPFAGRMRPVDTYNEFQAYIRDNFRDVVPGGFYLGNDIGPEPAPLMAYRINGNIGYAALAKNVLDSYLMGTTINAEFSTFALPFVGSTGDSLQLVLYITFAMCAYTAFFALYPTFERLSNIRALHYSNGVRPAPLWLAYWLFDAFFATVVAVVSIVLLASLADVWYGPAYLCIVIWLFGMSSTLLAYIVSLFSTSQLAAFAFVAGGQAIFALIYFLIYMVLITFAAAEQLQYNLNVLQYTLGLVSPSGNVLRAFLLTLNQSQLLCRGQAFVTYPGDITVYGGPILYLILQILVFYGILVWHDSGTKLSFPLRSKSGTTDTEKTITMPADVRAEAARVQSTEEKLRILHLTRRFGSDQVVDNVTLGVDGSEICALLGPNGAGKTTTLSLIRGNIHPSSRDSDVLVRGASIRKNQIAARKMLGVCPQFDTTDYMTVTEHLSFYARVRGVRDVKTNVARVIHAVGLSPYKHRRAGKLSGGNQRKLSLATSIIGNPSVLLLDEPSTGMDAVAMRIMWRAIASIKTNRAILLTTHSMEEASTLSDKAVILDRRLLAVSGTRDLVKLHGQGLYHVHLTLESGVDASSAEMGKVRDWFATTFPGTAAHDTSGAARRGQLRLAIPIASVAGNDVMAEKSGVEVSEHVEQADPLEKLFDVLEDNKEDLGISFYSISQPALEDVFLDVLSRNRDLGDE